MLIKIQDTAIPIADIKSVSVVRNFVNVLLKSGECQQFKFDSPAEAQSAFDALPTLGGRQGKKKYLAHYTSMIEGKGECKGNVDFTCDQLSKEVIEEVRQYILKDIQDKNHPFKVQGIVFQNFILLD